jgi:RNA polymerase sigma factor (sigma-70 family)
VATITLSVKQLWALYRRSPNEELLKALAIHYLPLLPLVAGAVKKKHRLPRDVAVEELAQDGYAGLRKAVQRYQPHRGTRFKNFAWNHIRGAILDAMRKRDWVPRLARQRKEVAPAMWSIDHIRWEQDDGQLVSVGELTTDHKELPPWARLAEGEEFERLLWGLPPREQEALRLVYRDGLLQREAADRMGVKESRVSLAIGDGLKKLREKLHWRRREAEELAAMGR